MLVPPRTNTIIRFTAAAPPFGAPRKLSTTNGTLPLDKSNHDEFTTFPREGPTKEAKIVE